MISTTIELNNKDNFGELFSRENQNQNQVLVDVGAYNGDTIDAALKYNHNLKIIAIEPIKNLCELMKQKFANNPNITIVNKAAYNKKCIIQLNEYGGWAKGLSTLQPIMAQLRPHGAIIKYDVQADTLDNILSENNIQIVDYLKIDTEGSEEQVLEGFTKYHSGTRFHVEHHLTNLSNILTTLLEKDANIEKITTYRDVNIKDHTVGAVIGTFETNAIKNEEIQQNIRTNKQFEAVSGYSQSLPLSTNVDSSIQPIQIEHIETSATMTNLFIIIPTLNSQYLSECLDSLWNKEKNIFDNRHGIKAEIIIIQDIPSQERLMYLDRINKRGSGAPTIIINYSQIGGPKAVNQGIRLALSKNADYILFVGDDCIFQTYNMLPIMVDILRNHPEYGYVSPIVEYEDNKQELFGGIGEGSLHNRQSFERVGLFDEGIEFQKIGTDIDYCYKLNAAGYNPHGVREMKVKHFVGSTIKATLTREDCILADNYIIKKWGPNAHRKTNCHILPVAPIIGKFIEERQSHALSASADAYMPAMSTSANATSILVPVPVPSVLKTISPESEERAGWIIRHIKAGEKVLDIGSSDGWIFRDAPFAPNVTSIDLDLYDIPNFIQMDASDLRFNDNSFDTAILGEILEHVPDAVRILKEANRVARRLLITVPDEINWAPENYPYETEEQMVKRRGLTIEQIVKVSNPNAKGFINDGYKHLFHIRHYDEKMLRQDLAKAEITNYEMNRLQYEGWSFFVVNTEKNKDINLLKQINTDIQKPADVLQITAGPINTLEHTIQDAHYIDIPNTNKLRIALISTPFFTVPPIGYSGLEQVLWDLAMGLDELGHEVTIFGPEGSKATPHGKVVAMCKSHNTVNVNWYDLEKECYDIYKNVINDKDFDIVNGHNWFGYEYLLKMANPKLNILHCHHGGYTWSSLPEYTKPNLVAISKFMQIYTENYFRQKGYDIKSEYIHNGIDIQKYHIGNLPKSGRLLFVGRLDSFKRPDLAIDVAKKLNLGLDIVGGTFVKDENYLNQIRSMCDGNQIKLHENATHEKKIELMQSAKCLLFTSQMGEPFGLSSIEAMACGLPVAAVNDGATEEIVQEGGIVCDVFDKKLTVQGWQYGLKKDPLDALAEAVGRIDRISPQQARTNAEKFDRKIMAKNYLILYNRLLNGEEW